MPIPDYRVVSLAQGIVILDNLREWFTCHGTPIPDYRVVHMPWDANPRLQSGSHGMGRQSPTTEWFAWHGTPIPDYRVVHRASEILNSKITELFCPELVLQSSDLLRR